MITLTDFGMMGVYHMSKKPTWPHALLKHLVLFLTGGLLYGGIEILWRGFTHPAMILVGGAAFLLVGGLNDWFPWALSLFDQGLLGGTVITGVEFLSGVVLNRWLELGIWDYSDLPFHVLGQICLPFWVLWCFLAVAAVLADDYLRWWLFGEAKPHYRLFPWQTRHS